MNIQDLINEMDREAAARMVASQGTTKVCKWCKVEKDVSEFYSIGRGKTGKRNVCKACYSAYGKGRRSR